MNAYSSETNPFWKTRKCRAFHNDKTCMYGIACLYKHELQGCKRKRRHFYIPTLATASYVYHNDQEDANMDEETCLSGARRLPIFENIHAMDIESEHTDEFDSEDDDCIKGQESSDDAANAETDLDSNWSTSGVPGKNSLRWEIEGLGLFEGFGLQINLLQY